MNIAFFTESYKPYISGVTVSIETLARELRARGHRVFIFAPHYAGHKDEDRDVFRFPSAPTPYPGFRIALPLSRKILSKIPELGIELVHSHSPFQLGLLAKRTARKLKVPFVYTFHTLFDQYLHYLPVLPKPLAKRLVSLYLKGFLNSSDCVIAPSSTVKDFLLREGVRTKIEVVPTGVDFELAKKFTGEGVRKKHGIPQDAVLLTYVGRLSKEKNLPFLLEAFKLIHENSPEARLMLVAHGPLEKKLKALASSLGISGRVIFAGGVSYPRVFDYYAASDIFAFSSTTETQGLVITEAAGMGLPVVAVASSGVSDTIADGVHGFLAPHDTEAFADRVLLLIRDEALRKKMAESAALHAKEHFSAGVYARAIEKVYNECYTEFLGRQI